MEVAPAHPVIAALSRTRTALDGTVTPIPAGHTQAGAVLALAMHLTPLITLLALALSALPAVLTDAGSILTAAVLPTVEAAQSDAAVLAGPAGFTGTGVC